MKTIAVLTDFTLRAEHTALYALEFARQIKANILLCHILPAQTTVGYVEVLVNDTQQDKIDAMYDLAELSRCLRQRLNNSTAESDFKPKIECCIKAGTMANVVNDMVADKGVLMVAISEHRLNRLTALLIGSHTKELIDNARCPVLIVPYELRFNEVKRIAFATDLAKSGIQALSDLSEMAKDAGSEIVITYVSNKKLLDSADDTVLQNFFDQVAATIPYPKKRYRLIKNRDVLDGLKNLPDNIDVDLIAMVHRKRNYLSKLFSTSVSLFMANNLTKPVLIFPLQPAALPLMAIQGI